MQHIKAIFDIGNYAIKWVIFAQDQWKNVVLVKDMVKTKWLRKWKVIDPVELTESIAQIIATFNKKLGGDFLDEVYVGISHPDMIVTRIQESKRIMTDKIGHEDLNHLSKIIGDVALQPNYELLKIHHVTRTIDENIQLSESPLGMEGKKLELAADTFLLPKNFYNHLVDIFDKLDLNIVDIVPNILGSGELMIDSESKELGTLLIDIGHNQTNFVLYEDGLPTRYEVLAMGWEDVTKDISIWLQLDIKEAETIKLDHGYVGDEEPLTHETPMDGAFLREIVSARYEELFGYINNYLCDLDKDGRLAGGVVLIGGASKIRWLTKLAKDSFKLSCILGHDSTLNMWDLSQNIQFSNILGTYFWSEKYHDHKKSNTFKVSFGRLWGLRKFLKEVF